MPTPSPSAASAAPRLLVVLTALAQVMTPALPSLKIGEPIGSQSDAVRTLITPAGWAFSIWGPLYLGSILFAIYQALPAQANDPLLARIRMPAACAFLGNAVWAAYTQVFGLSIVSFAIIAITLASLLTVYRRLYRWSVAFTSGQRWLVVLPLSALAAWLSAATIVNAAAALRFHGVEAGDNAALIAAAVILVGGVIAGLALLRTGGNPFYVIVFLWALGAIYAAGGQEARAVGGAAVVAAILVVAGAVMGLRNGGAARWLSNDGSATRDLSHARG